MIIIYLILFTCLDELRRGHHFGMFKYSLETVLSVQSNFWSGILNFYNTSELAPALPCYTNTAGVYKMHCEKLRKVQMPEIYKMIKCIKTKFSRMIYSFIFHIFKSPLKWRLRRWVGQRWVGLERLSVPTSRAEHCQQENYWTRPSTTLAQILFCWFWPELVTTFHAYWDINYSFAWPSADTQHSLMNHHQFSEAQGNCSNFAMPRGMSQEC